MLGQSHHGINSCKGRHKQHNGSNRFPIHTAFAGRNPWRHTHKNSPDRNTTGRTRRVSFRLSRCGANTWLHRPHTGSLWSCGFGLCRWLRTVNLTSSGNTSILWKHFFKAYKPFAQKNYHVSTDTAFRARLDCTKSGDVKQNNSPGRNSTGTTRRTFSVLQNGSTAWLHGLQAGSLWRGAFGLCRWLRTGNSALCGNTPILWRHLY